MRDFCSTAHPALTSQTTSFQRIRHSLTAASQGTLPAHAPGAGPVFLRLSLGCRTERPVSLTDSAARGLVCRAQEEVAETRPPSPSQT